MYKQSTCTYLLLISLIVVTVSSERYRGLKDRNRYSYNIRGGAADTITMDHEYMINDNEDEIPIYVDDDAFRDLIRENTTLSRLVDHTTLTSYDESEWWLLFFLMLVAPALVGLVCAISCHVAFTSDGESRNSRWSTKSVYRGMLD